MPVLAEHFTQPPHWAAYIIGYFFLAGLAGGSYVLGSLVRLAGRPADEPVARAAFLVSIVAVALCPVLLALDLGQPLRFWHMLIDSGTGGPAFKWYSPMSAGAYALLFFGVFSFVSAADALLSRGRPSPLAVIARGPIGIVWMAAGSLLGLYVAAYTGVLLAVSNQPVWSDAWPLGGLFLASGLSASAALLALGARRRAAGPDGRPEMLAVADRAFVILEAVLLVLFLATVVIAGSAGKLFSPAWLILWLLVIAGILAPLVSTRRVSAAFSSLAAPVLVLVGVLALRAVVILSAQS
jgi:formate-dependent nitrite reductase membrane component NrfD